MSGKPKAVVLLSGGLDSTTVLAIAKSQGYETHCLSFDYGQRHTYELEAAKKVAKALQADSHVFCKLDLRVFGGSALTTDTIDVPKDRSEATMSTGKIPVTYVPARNTIFLSYALAFAEVLKSSVIFIGINAVDYSGYPDCRPDYIAAYEKMAQLATKTGVEGETTLKIHTPLLTMTKLDIVKAGLALNVDYSITHSCYDPKGPEGSIPCEHCDSCILRITAFESLGKRDPTLPPL
jgi:7-cyano-7-deazaguanine synthase